MRHVLIFLCLLLCSSAVYAHTFVFINGNPDLASPSEHFVSSTPGANQTLDKAPDAVVITFSSPINPNKSSMGIYDLYGTRLDDGTVTVNGAAMTVSLPPLPPGKYAVKWKTRCLCEDDNELSDEFHFTVR